MNNLERIVDELLKHDSNRRRIYLMLIDIYKKNNEHYSSIAKEKSDVNKYLKNLDDIVNSEINRIDK